MRLKEEEYMDEDADSLGHKDERKAKGGRARAKALAPKKRAEIARNAAHARWARAADTGMVTGSDEDEALEVGLCPWLNGVAR